MNKHCFDELIFTGAQFKAIPANGFFKLDDLHLLKLLEAILNFDRNFLRSIRFVGFEIQIHANLRNLHFPVEHDVDEVRLLAIGLPEGVDVVIAKLVDPIALLGGGQVPDGQVPDLPSTTVRLWHLVAPIAHADMSG